MIRAFSHQYFGRETPRFLECYDAVMRKRYSHLIYDARCSTNDDLRVYTAFVPSLYDDDDGNDDDVAVFEESPPGTRPPAAVEPPVEERKARESREGREKDEEGEEEEDSLGPRNSVERIGPSPQPSASLSPDYKTEHDSHINQRLINHILKTSTIYLVPKKAQSKRDKKALI